MQWQNSRQGYHAGRGASINCSTGTYISELDANRYRLDFKWNISRAEMSSINNECNCTNQCNIPLLTEWLSYAGQWWNLQIIYECTGTQNMIYVTA